MTNTIAIGDVHGSYSVLLETLEPLFDTQSELIFLGDLFDRSPEPGGDFKVLELVYDMHQHPEDYGLSNVECLMGNHEHLLLEALDGDYECWYMNGGDIGFLQSLVSRPDYIKWIQERPLYIIRDDYLLVHAGVRPDISLTDQAAHDFMWIRPDPNQPHNLPYTIVHGHTIHNDVTYYRDRVAIDTGAFHSGKLSTFAL